MHVPPSSKGCAPVSCLPVFLRQWLEPFVVVLLLLQEITIVFVILPFLIDLIIVVGLFLLILDPRRSVDSSA